LRDLVMALGPGEHALGEPARRRTARSISSTP